MKKLLVPLAVLLAIVDGAAFYVWRTHSERWLERFGL